MTSLARLPRWRRTLDITKMPRQQILSWRQQCLLSRKKPCNSWFLLQFLKRSKLPALPFLPWSTWSSRMRIRLKGSHPTSWASLLCRWVFTSWCQCYTGSAIVSRSLSTMGAATPLRLSSTTKWWISRSAVALGIVAKVRCSLFSLRLARLLSWSAIECPTLQGPLPVPQWLPSTPTKCLECPSFTPSWWASALCNLCRCLIDAWSHFVKPRMRFKNPINLSWVSSSIIWKWSSSMGGLIFSKVKFSGRGKSGMRLQLE